MRLAPAGLTLLLLATIVLIARPGPVTPEVLAWQPAGELAAPRAYGSAVTLTTGEILVVGGLDRDDPHVVNFTTELFDPVTGRTRVLNQLLPGRVNGSVTVGWDGRVVMAGGSEWRGDHWAVMDRVDVFLPLQRKWIHGHPMLQARTGQRATALGDGRIFVTGGYDGPRLIGTSEIYDPRTDTWTLAAPMPDVRGDFAMTTLRSGKVLVAGGLEGKDSAPTLTSILYVPELDEWWNGPPLNAERVLFAQAKLPNGDLLIIGGQGPASGTAERYDVRQGLFIYAGTLAIPRLVADAAALPDGRVIVTGGLPETPSRHDFTPLSGTELWDPATNLWRDVAPVSSARAFARLVVAHRGIYQMSGVASDEHADPTVERFVWR
jgi:Kelch motif protein